MADYSELEERCFEFARRVKVLIKSCRMNVTNTSIACQLMDSSGSVGANYIEANEALSNKDFMFISDFEISFFEFKFKSEVIHLIVKNKCS
jgi:four helix bundle protein